MASSYNTLAGLIQFNDKNLADLQITDLLDEAPLLKVLTAVSASNGTQHKYLKQTTASSAAFRDALDGATKTASADTLVTETLKIIDGSFDTDVALADAYKGGRDAWLQMELVRTLKQIMFTVERQIFYGAASPGSTSGFSGLRDNAALDDLSDAMCIPAGTAGSTPSVQTSVYALRHDVNNCAIIAGNDGRFVVEDEPTIIQKAGSGSGYFPALYVPVTGYLGFQYGSAYSAGRIANIETALDDDDIADLVALFPASRKPNVICMSRKAVKLLRKSRTAVNVTGAPAPFPTEWEGIPIVVTDAIVDTEAVET
jgi:hypothetical protein